MRIFAATALGLVLFLDASSAQAQSVGGSGGIGSSGGMGSSGGIGASASGGSGIQGGIGGASLNTQTWPPSPWPPSLGSAENAIGTDQGSTQQRSTEGSGTINTVNVDAVARSGNVGAATTIGNRSGTSTTGASKTKANTFQSISGMGPESLFNIPLPVVSVDLLAIRQAVSIGPNATPDSRGY